MFSLPTENRVWTRCQILLKWTYFRTWNWKQPLFDQMTHNKTKNIVQINQDVKKGQWPGVSTEFVHLFLCPSISISLCAVENEDQLVSSFTLLLIFKSCPTGKKPQETQKNKTSVLMKTNISWIYSFIVSTLIKLILINLFPEILDRNTKKIVIKLPVIKLHMSLSNVSPKLFVPSVCEAESRYIAGAAWQRERINTSFCPFHSLLPNSFAAY